MVTPATIIVAGAVAQRPGHGGHASVFLQYLLGFRDLGWEVLFLDRMEPGSCVDERGLPSPLASSVNVRYVSEVMDRFGLGGDWAVLHGEEEAAGLDRREVLARAERSPLLLNVMGYLDDEEILEAVGLRVFVDIDPGFGQIWQETGLARIFDGHDRHVSVGELIGTPGCEVPSCGIDWIGTKPPVHLESWPATPGSGRRFTSVASWRGPFGPLEYEGRSYGLRVHELRRFLELPALTSADFELALSIDRTAEGEDVRRLRDHGWALVDPGVEVATPERYRAYIQGSSAELMVAKNLYVDLPSGWFSDRSACYLASARPVLAEDTGLAGLLPLGEGLLAFSTPEEAVAGVERILADYEVHAAAARAIAEEHFSTSRVLPRLLDALGIG